MVRNTLIVVLALLLFLSAGATAAENREIFQAVKDGVPNTADNRVVMAEIVAGDW